MGNKASTARKLQLEVTKKSESFTRSKINQLPSQELKQKFINLQASSQTTPIETPSQSIPEGKDGFDPQMSPQENQDFIRAISKLGKVIESRENKPISVNSESLNQLKIRKKLEANEIFSSQQLTSLIQELNDDRYSIKRVLKDHELSEDWLPVLNRFKVASTYREFKEKKKDEITHEGVLEKKTFIDEQLRLDNSKRNEQLKSRINIDD